MGSFSWMFADCGNQIALHIGETGYLILPDDTALKAENGYDGGGCFGPGDHIDAYVEVAQWNRKYLSEHPNFVVPQHGYQHAEDGSLVERADKVISLFSWWPYYADMSLSKKDIETKMREATGDMDWEYRYIGIDLACYDDQNNSLPYPIKIASKPVPYGSIPASMLDPNQGSGGEEDDSYEEEEDDEDDDEVPTVSAWTDRDGTPVCPRCGCEQMCDHFGHFKPSKYCPSCGKRLMQ